MLPQSLPRWDHATPMQAMSCHIIITTITAKRPPNMKATTTIMTHTIMKVTIMKVTVMKATTTLKKLNLIQTKSY